MLHFRARSASALLTAALLAACERERSVPRVDSVLAGGTAATASPVPTPTPSGWDTGAGSYLLVPGPSATVALVIDPEQRGTLEAAPATDSSAFAGRPALLLGLGGQRLAARIGTAAAHPADEECVAPWPLVHVEADTLVGPWQVGFVGGDARPIVADSLAALPAADSGAVVAAAARLASSLPVAEEAYFRGLPFAVRSVHRFSPAAGVQALAAALVRRVNQEDSPLEERTFMIAERAGDQPWRVAYQERSTGTEDDVESAESVAPFALGDRTLLVVVHELSDGLSYRLLLRTGPARWRVMWTSAVGKCVSR